MLKLASQALVGILLANNIAFAECDFSSGIKKVSDGYLYTEECHTQVGVSLKELSQRREQVESLTKAIKLKDLALAKSDERIEKWQETTFKLEDRVNTIDSMRSTQNVLYFVGGVLLTGLAVWGAGQLR